MQFESERIRRIWVKRGLSEKFGLSWIKRSDRQSDC